MKVEWGGSSLETNTKPTLHLAQPWLFVQRVCKQFRADMLNIPVACNTSEQVPQHQSTLIKGPDNPTSQALPIIRKSG